MDPLLLLLLSLPSRYWTSTYKDVLLALGKDTP